MKLELCKVVVKRLKFGEKTEAANGTLTINKEELKALLLEDERYALLKGGVLEASARLFQQQVHLLVYPVESSLFSSYLELVNFDTKRISFPKSGMVRAQNLSLAHVNQHLYRYLVESDIIVDVDVDDSPGMAK